MSEIRSASNPTAGRHAQPVTAPGTASTDGHTAPARVYLQPIAPPVTVGLWGFFASTMVLSTWMLHWWGTTTSPMYFFTFNAAFGGLAQFLAGLWSFKARDYIASSLLTMWGGFWMAWGLVQGLAAAHVMPVLPPTTPQPGAGSLVHPARDLHPRRRARGDLPQAQQLPAVCAAVHRRRRRSLCLRRILDR